MTLYPVCTSLLVENSNTELPIVEVWTPSTMQFTVRPTNPSVKLTLSWDVKQLFCCEIPSPNISPSLQIFVGRGLDPKSRLRSVISWLMHWNAVPFQIVNTPPATVHSNITLCCGHKHWVIIVKLLAASIASTWNRKIYNYSIILCM